MKKYLILYYSKTGNSQFLAEKLSEELNGDLKRVTPWMNGILPLLLLSKLKIRIGVDVSEKNLAGYDEIVIVGPIWSGLLVAPLRSLIHQCIRASKVFHFAVSCETSDEESDGKYGYSQVLKEAERLGGRFIKTTEAFSTALVKKEGEARSLNPSKKTKFTDDNFKGSIKSRFDKYLTRIRLVD